ncbi:NAD-dependent epimerase/dehydratase family protein [Crossiella sp. SN42]|uniref:NAD-dependent epimerase/dehydratase family protein n=1 Tax=Crossiella sp. SN42 TaxID=2944808 RepID=UPI00207C5E97|nr:NAD-dependent epimerase/dehydratase family protein [Crossiella sp. SN42]MCO1580325.1 NAD-dependent epimerase/dehydratase family protein [Crossiella sp. SN42]
MPLTAPELDRTGRAIHRAVIIGGAGFIGSSLSAALTSCHIDTACFTRRSPFLHQDELSYPLHTTRIVYYLASSINPALGEAHPDWAAADLALFGRLLRRLARLAEPPAVVLTSSGGTVYDQAVPPPYAETDPVRATGRYGAAKLALEQELFRHSDRVPGAILRLSNVYGPGQRAVKGQGVLAHWLGAVLDDRPLRIVGDPAASRDYVHIDDLVAAIHLLDRHIRTGGLAGRGEPLVLNIGSGRPTSLTELVRVVRAATGRDVPVELLPARRYDRQHVWLDVRAAAAVLGWRPVTGLAEGVAGMWRWLRARP